MRRGHFGLSGIWMFGLTRSTVAILLASFCILGFAQHAQGENPAASSQMTQTVGNITLRPPSLNSDNGCRSCHRMDHGFSHPVDVVPSASIRMPDDLPLNANGQMTCTTCHDTNSGQGHAQRSSGRGRNYQLRQTLTAGFGNGCAVCHRTQTQTVRKGKVSHGLASERAHYMKASTSASASSGTVIYAYATAGTGLDAESRNCLSCHDGTIAQDIGREQHQGHPVGIAYGNSSPGRDMPVRPANTLDSRIMLFDGQIGCNTCHNPYSTEKSRLVMSNTRSALCLSCHRG